jgi:hypothetical protein
MVTNGGPPLHRLEVRRGWGLRNVPEATAKRKDPSQGVSKAVLFLLCR